jgi:cobalt-zinc-cadmium efflux system membrane fusion protein
MNKLKILIAALAVTAFATGCGKKEDDHGHPHPEEQAVHEEAGHGHGHGGGIAVTHYTDQTELFVEYPPLAKGEESAFAAHLTHLNPQGFRAVSEGKLTVLLTGGGLPDEQAEAGISDTPGIFRPVLKPQHAGKRHLALRLDLPGGPVTHDLGEVTVYPDRKSAEAALPQEEEGTAIGFTKEQQWKIPFATQPAEERAVRESIPVTATLRPSTEREAIVAAPGAGLLRNGPNGFPQVGSMVKAGEIVAFLAPRLGGEADVATLRLEADRARIAVEQARVERERLEGLLKLEAIPAKRVQDAVAQEKLAQANLSAAQQRVATFSGGGGGIALKSPVTGTIVAVGAVPGAAVSEGQTVVHVADLKRLWLEAHIPESVVTQVSRPDGAFFTLGEDTAPIQLEVGKNARLVAYGGMVDPATRTVPVIFEFDNSEGRLRSGMTFNANLYTGRSLQGIAVPASALVDDGGTPVVYALREGESFERRVVTPGPRDGKWVGIQSGLKAGERVVTLGAYQVRLAATIPAAIGHGHAH